jgi:hypothetical protein
MDFGETHRFLKRVNIAPLVERVRATDDSLWDSEDDRRAPDALNLSILHLRALHAA